jgi:hypothetical protein
VARKRSGHESSASTANGGATALGTAQCAWLASSCSFYRRLGRSVLKSSLRHGCGVRWRREWAGGGMVGAMPPVRVWRVVQGERAGRRFGTGSPTAHNPADGSRPRRSGPEGPTPRVTRDGTLWNAKGQKPFRLAYSDQVFLKLFQLKCTLR